MLSLFVTAAVATKTAEELEVDLGDLELGNELEVVESRRRQMDYTAYCQNNYNTQAECNGDSVCSWIGAPQVGTCSAKQVKGCPAKNYNTCYGVGVNGRPCKWVGVAQAGSCQENINTANCGMYYAQTACPTQQGCAWTGSQCIDPAQPTSTPASQCGMFYVESACSQPGCQWNGSQCVHISASTCGMFYNYNSCQQTSGCSWSHYSNECMETTDHPCTAMGTKQSCQKYHSWCYWSRHARSCRGYELTSVEL